MIIELKSNSAIAKIDTKGAELVSFEDVFGLEYMWQKDSKYWGRTSPILFPIVGNLRKDKTIINGTEYCISKHGFCRDAEFKAVYKTDTKVILNYSFTTETLKVFPYKFSLSLTYSLDGGELSITYTVINMDDKPIDYCIGAHPAFNINSDEFEEYSLSFDQKEPEGCPVYDLSNMQFDVQNRRKLLDDDNKMMLKYSLFDEDAIVFDHCNSSSIKLASIKTGRGVQVDIEGFSSVAFWTPTKQNAPFLCIEPWNGMAVRSDEDDEFIHKYGVKHLEVDEQSSCKLTIIPM